MSDRTKVLLIAGAGRSGSTLLARLLGELPGAANVGELSLLWVSGIERQDLCGCGNAVLRCSYWARILDDAFPVGLPDVERVLAVRGRATGFRTWMSSKLTGSSPRRSREAIAEYRILMENLYRTVQADTDANVIVDASKLVTHVLPLLESPLLDIRVLHLVRDSRAVAFSLQRRKLDPGRASGEFMNRESPERTARYWTKINLLTHVVGRAHGRYLRVRYEDLLRDPTRQMERVAAFMGLSTAPSSFLSQGVADLSTQHTIGGNPDRLRTGPVPLRLDDEWIGRMEPIQRRAVIRRTWPLMAAYGYLGRRGNAPARERRGVTVRVLYVIDSLAPGGAETSLVAMAPVLLAEGVDLHVAYLHRKDGLEGVLREAGVRTYAIEGPGNRRRLAQLRGLIDQVRPDLIHTTLAEADLLGRVAAWLEHVPTVTSLVNVQYGPEHFRDPRIRAWRLRTWQLADALTARTVTRFHAVGSDVGDVMAGRLAIPRRKIDVVPRGRDAVVLGNPSAGRRRAARARLDVDDAADVVLALGRHEYQKAFDVLLLAAGLLRRSHPSLRVLIAGRAGSTTAELDRSIEDLGLAGIVRFLGHRDDVPDLLCAADVFVLPSRREGSPGSLIEAMALGVPCVASDIPSVREVAGSPPVVRLVPPEEPEALATAVGDLLRDRVAASELGAHARARFQTCYALDPSVRALTGVYERALADAARGR